MSNIAELQATMTEIRDHPERLGQANWVCGTTACYAGLTALRHGWRSGIDPLSGDMHRDGKTEHARDIAQRILELDDEERLRLFHFANSVDTLEQMVKDLGNGEDLASLWVPHILGAGAIASYSRTGRLDEQP